MYRKQSGIVGCEHFACFPIDSCNSYCYSPNPALDTVVSVTVHIHSYCDCWPTKEKRLLTISKFFWGNMSPSGYLPHLFPVAVAEKEVMGSQSKILNWQQESYFPLKHPMRNEEWSRRSRKKGENSSLGCKPCILWQVLLVLPAAHSEISVMHKVFVYLEIISYSQFKKLSKDNSHDIKTY